MIRNKPAEATLRQFFTTPIANPSPGFSGTGATGAPSPVLVALGPGSSGSAVDTLPADLTVLRYNVTGSGDYDSRTAQAVSPFEADNGPSVTTPTTLALQGALLTQRNPTVLTILVGLGPGSPARTCTPCRQISRFLAIRSKARASTRPVRPPR